MSKKNQKDVFGPHWHKNTFGNNISSTAKTKIDALLQNHASSNSMKLIFPANLSNTERAYIHRTAALVGWKSESKGEGENRFITVIKPNSTGKCEEPLQLCKASLKLFKELEPLIEHETRFSGMATHMESKKKDSLNVAKLGYGPPKIPPAKTHRSDKYITYRKSLPIWSHAEEICRLARNNVVTFIKGDTGCGKTTQVPQFLLDEARTNGTPIRIICTVPRRIAAVSISDRVATERGERVGSTVGYQIRLEKCFSRTETVLTYCTSGILLRSITSPECNLLQNLTHIIIDEVHERDRCTDFLLACLKSLLSGFKNLRVILMGADLNVQLFTDYFGGSLHCPTIHVQGRTFPVERFFLEDVLDIVGFKTKEEMVDTLLPPFAQKSQKMSNIGRRLADGKMYNNSSPSSKTKPPQQSENDWEEFVVVHNSNSINVNSLIEDVFKTGNTDQYDIFVDLVTKDVISIDCKHSDPDSDLNMLSALAARGDYYRVNYLVQMGADVQIRSNGIYKFTAKDWSDQYGHEQVSHMLGVEEEVALKKKSDQKVNAYLEDIDTEKVDLLLASKIIKCLHNEEDKINAILVFLPGYDEMMILKRILVEDVCEEFVDYDFDIHLLHSNIQTNDQRAAFDRPKKGFRKIILSTNIAETSLTIEDIVYVIDSGKVKEKSYDVISGISELKSVWISKAAANQRMGRAGRCQAGKCYRLYSTSQYESMDEFPTPEIIRTSLHELCLSSRSFLSPDCSIEHFFSLIPEPPAPIAVQKAVKELIYMGALNKEEYLTDLGIHLVDFPVEPRLGKAIIYSIVLQCLDPVVTIVSALSHKDPFQLPSDPDLKKAANEIKRHFAGESFSDHKALLNLYKEWEEQIDRGRKCEYDFCKSKFVSSSSLKMIAGIRTQLLNQVRASGFVTTSWEMQDANRNSSNWTVIKAVLTAMLYPSLCCVRPNKQCLFSCNEGHIIFHKSTTVHSKKDNWTTDIPSKWVIYDEMTRTGPLSAIRNCTMISTPMLALMAANFIVPQKKIDDVDDGMSDPVSSKTSQTLTEETTLVVSFDSWLSLTALSSTISPILELRNYLDNLIVNKLKNPRYKLKEEDIKFIRVFSNILTEEDIGCYLIPGKVSKPKKGQQRSEMQRTLTELIRRRLQSS